MTNHDMDPIGSIQILLSDDVSEAQKDRVWTKLHNRHNPEIVRFAGKYVHNKAEDMAQETWVRVSRNLDKFDPFKSSFTTWLHTICKNLCLNELTKAKKREQLREIRPLRFDVGDAAGDAYSPDFMEELDEILNASGMTDKQYETLRLVVQGHTLRETLTQTGASSISAVKNRLHRARVKMREAAIKMDLDPWALVK